MRDVVEGVPCQELLPGVSATGSAFSLAQSSQWPAQADSVLTRRYDGPSHSSRTHVSTVGSGKRSTVLPFRMSCDLHGN